MQTVLNAHHSIVKYIKQSPDAFHEIDTLINSRNGKKSIAVFNSKEGSFSNNSRYTIQRARRNEEGSAGDDWQAASKLTEK